MRAHHTAELSRRSFIAALFAASGLPFVPSTIRAAQSGAAWTESAFRKAEPIIDAIHSGPRRRHAPATEIPFLSGRRPLLPGALRRKPGAFGQAAPRSGRRTPKRRRCARCGAARAMGTGHPRGIQPRARAFRKALRCFACAQSFASRSALFGIRAQACSRAVSSRRSCPASGFMPRQAASLPRE